ncbi:helix-turn-helix transcriptional regulator [Dactylosporangium sp. NPDC000244]|uniref:helix-turn-helix transcriptional regulator n=1 Tax=Dactylosporangium sp. NPDC000244 TaxID=3154365 RepID=UPI003316C28C
MTSSSAVAPARQRLPVVAAASAGAAGITLGGLGLAGHGGFATDPAGVLALALGAVGTAVAGARLSRAGSRAAGRYAAGLAAALLAYLALTALAVAAHAAGHPLTGAAVALWNSAWIPPLVLMQLTASAAVRRAAPWTHRAVGAAMGVVALANALLTSAGEPFAGLPTIAPESWRTMLAPVDAAATLLGGVALLVLPVVLWRAALGSHGTVRGRLGVAAAGTTAAPLTVAFCVLLAVARAPGGVEPELGSVAFLVALGGAAVCSGACALVAARGAVAPAHLLLAVRGAGLTAAALVVAGTGTVVAAPGLALGATPVALVVAAITAVVGTAAWAGTGRLARTLVPPAPADNAVPVGTAVPVNTAAPAAPEDPASHADAAVPADGGAVGRLTAREAEVLSALAEGASNAGIAAQLVISERTVDAHLRAIFAKLDLSPESGGNRRVQAARYWLEHAGPAVSPK